MTGPRKHQLQVEHVRRAGTEFAWLELAAPPEWQSVPGQFGNILCDPGAAPPEERLLEYGDDDDRRPLLQNSETRELAPLVRRPVSISDVLTVRGGRHVILLVRIVGPGSSYLGSRQPGDVLDVIAPIGNGFDLAIPTRRAFLIGGGCGIAPLVGLARQLVEAGKEVVIFYGCRSRRFIPLGLPGAAAPTDRNVVPLEDVAEFPAIKLIVATEDGSLGFHGLVTDAMTVYGEQHGWAETSFYACGPDVMMAAVAALAQVRDVGRCQVSLENYMGCATGVCLSCAAKIRDGSERGWSFKQACQDGPVFEASRVIFENKWEGCKR